MSLEPRKHRDESAHTGHCCAECRAQIQDLFLRCQQFEREIRERLDPEPAGSFNADGTAFIYDLDRIGEKP